jgi:hypothetical protein
LILFENEVTLLVTLKLATEVENIETTAIEIEETREVLVRCQLLFVEFLPAVLVTYIAFTVNQQSLFIDKSTFLVKHVFVYDWSPYTIVIKISMHLEWVKVVLLNAVRSRYLTSFIDVFLIKHLAVLVIFDNVTCVFVFQVTSLIHRTTSFVNIIACLILQHNYISFIITV